MLRNRSKISQRKNFRNARKRNHANSDLSSELSSSSDTESSQIDSSSAILFEDSSDSSEEECTSPVIGRKLKTRRKRMSSKSKCNKENDNRNRNSRSSNVSNKRKPHHKSDSHTAGPSRVNNSRRSRSQNSNTRTAKRKYKDEDDESMTSEGPCNTSSEELSESMLFPMKKKRVRRVLSNSSESDDSDIRASTRRRSILDSESSSGASEIRHAGRRRNQRLLVASGSDSTSERVEENSTRGSSSSPALILPRVRARGILRGSSGSPVISSRGRRNSRNQVQSSDSTSSSSSMSISLFSTDSEVVNTVSMLDSEASSYNTAQSSNNNNKDQVSDSDSSDSDGEKCAICLKKFRTQLIGNPSNCEHNFCAPCLKKWSESSTTCPVDRSTFDSIVIRSEINGQVVDRVKVENRNFGVFPPLDIDEVLLNDAINCEICGSGEDEETLLLCDFCNLGYHMACLIPPLSAIPAGSWFCPQCMELHSNPSLNMSEVNSIDQPYQISDSVYSSNFLYEEDPSTVNGCTIA